jgi:patatin-related protein
MDQAPELRIALAMRGGVSLAVWMGGACSEIDALRRAEPVRLDAGRPLVTNGAVPPTAAVYERLLTACGYSGVAVDVVAGASAGGLNGALMGCSVVHGMPLGSDIRDLWLELGDIGALTRSRSLGPAPSVLDADGRFYGPLFRKLTGLLQHVTPPLPGSVRLDLTLTGTLFQPRPSTRYQDLGDAIVEPRHRARFRFRHLAVPDEPLLCDFGRTGARDDALRRLAYAARATSSFPGAFEPALVGCTESPDPAADEQQGGGPVRPRQDREPVAPPATLYGVYSESREPEAGDVQRDLVIDGGVLDNIPLAWAVRSIAAAPARGTVDRWLVYLQPVPFAELEMPNERRPDIRATIKRARKLRSGSETLTDDIDELERLRSSNLSREGFRMVVEYALGEKRAAHARHDGGQVAAETDEEFLRGLFGRALAATDAYRERLGIIEASRLRQLWADPLPVLGADPLGYAQFRWVNRGGEARAKLLARLPAGASLADAVLPASPVDAAPSADAALSADAAPPADAGPASDTYADRALAEQTSTLVGIGRQIRTPQALARTVAALLDSARDLGEPGQDLKRRLYDERARIELLIAWHDRHLAAEPFKADVDDAEPIDVARRAAQRLAGPRRRDLGDVEVPAEGWPREAFEDHWAELVSLASELAAVAHPPQRAILSCLMSAASGADRDARMEAVLVATELLTGPSRPDPLADTTHIRFHMLSARNVSRLVEQLRPAASNGRRGRQERPLEEPSAGESRRDPLTVDEKLAGNQLANFGAFLRARWRQNDWIWGRLDAARSLVDILTASDPDGRVDWSALAALAGEKADATHEDVADRLVELLHERILLDELPLLRVLGAGPPNVRQRRKVRPLEDGVDEEAVLPLIRTGRETVLSALTKDPRRIVVALRLLDLGAFGWATGSARAVAGATTAAARRGRAALADRLRPRRPPRPSAGAAADPVDATRPVAGDGRR